MNLYEISNAIRLLTDAATTESGELPPGAEEQFDTESARLGLLLEQKVEVLCRVIAEHKAESKVLEAKADAFFDEGNRIKALARTQLNAAARWMAYIKRALEALEMQRIKVETFKVWIQRNGQPSLKVECDPERLPIEFQQFRCESNREALLAAWKADPLSLPSGVTCEVGTHLRIS